MRNELAPAILAGLALFTASCGNTGQANADGQRTLRAHTEVIQFTTVSDEFQVPGTIRARTTTVLSAKIVGQIVSLSVREGDRVRQGQTVAEIDNHEAATQLRRAQAAVVEARHGSEEADRAIQ